MNQDSDKQYEIEILNMHFEILKTVLKVEPELKLGDEAKEYIRKNSNEQCLDKITKGAFIYEHNIVAVVDPKNIKTLAHEMRHAWQYKNRETIGFDFDGSKKTKISDYIFSKKEADARKFAKYYCKLMGLIPLIDS